jgi:hypothetical protein
MLVIALCAFLGGCSWWNTKPTTDHVDVCNQPPAADPIVMREVDPVVIKDSYGISWVAITPKHYENLSLNTQETLKHIKQQNAVIEYYRECYKKK